MRILFILITTFIIAFFGAGCSKNNLETSCKIPKYYRLWKKPIKKIIDHPVPGHCQGFRVIYANDIAYTAKTIVDKDGIGQRIYPDGSIVIKETYKNKKDINWKDPIINIMIKDKNNKNAREGWLYYTRKPGQKNAMLITGRMCAGCHEAANEKHPYFDKNKKGMFRDYLFIKIVK